MAKIVQAVNVMISNPELITKVARGTHDQNEFYFEYKKFIWSLRKADDDYFLFYYPGKTKVEDVARLGSFDNVDMMSYSTLAIRTTEAEQSFSELYEILRERLYGMNLVLDEIIGGDDL